MGDKEEGGKKEKREKNAGKNRGERMNGDERGGTFNLSIRVME